MPDAVYELTETEHRVFVEFGAGEGATLPGDEYQVAGARLVRDAEVLVVDRDIDHLRSV